VKHNSLLDTMTFLHLMPDEREDAHLCEYL